jgi:hypothetical protein
MKLSVVFSACMQVEVNAGNYQFGVNIPYFIDNMRDSIGM